MIEKSKRTDVKKKKGNDKTFIASVICFLTVTLLFRTILYLGFVPSTSMSPTIDKGSIILGLRIFSKDNITKGDVVVFEHNGEMLVKRVAATSGDTVTVQNGIVTVHDSAESVEDGLTLQDGEFYMLGDNAGASLDSRFWEEPLVNKKDIKAVVMLPNTER